MMISKPSVSTATITGDTRARTLPFDDAEPSRSQVTALRTLSSFGRRRRRVRGRTMTSEWDDDRDSPLPSLLDVDRADCRGKLEVSSPLGDGQRTSWPGIMLLNSLFRDERPRLFHSLSKKPPGLAARPRRSSSGVTAGSGDSTWRPSASAPRPSLAHEPGQLQRLGSER